MPSIRRRSRLATSASWIFGDALRAAAAVVGRRQRVVDLVAAAGQCLAERRQFLDLLHREREPALHVGIEIGFQFEVDRDVEQRAGRRDLDAVGAELGDHRFEPVEQRGSDRPARCCGRR